MLDMMNEKEFKKFEQMILEKHKKERELLDALRHSIFQRSAFFSPEPQSIPNLKGEIINIIASLPGEFTIKDVQSKIPGARPTSVYNTLQRLEKKERVLTVVQEGSGRYNPTVYGKTDAFKRLLPRTA
jgi:hypothetical protein